MLTTVDPVKIKPELLRVPAKEAKYLLKNVAKLYNDGTMNIFNFKYKIYKNRGGLEPQKQKELPYIIPKTKSALEQYVADDRSVRRTHTLITDYVKINDFNLFVNITFDPSKIDTKNDYAVAKAFKIWLQNQKRLNPTFEYLAVPERHKNGAIHFHCLFMGYPDKKLKRALNNKISSPYYGLPLIDKSGRPVYNLTSYKLGLNDVTYITNKEATSYYVRKYITKDLALNIINSKRFWASHGLRKPEKVENLPLDLYVMADDLPQRSQGTFDMYTRPQVSYVPPTSH